MCCKYTKLYFAANSHVTTFIALSSESCSVSQDYNLVLSFQYYYLLLMSFEQIKICAFKREIMNILLACLTSYSMPCCFKVLRYQMFWTFFSHTHMGAACHILRKQTQMLNCITTPPHKLLITGQDASLLTN